MTGLQDENGARYITWSYSCTGKATMSMLADGVEKVELNYDGAPRWINVQHTVGPADKPATTFRYFEAAKVAGVFYNIGIDKPCAECGAFANRIYDVKGNLVSAKDWNGNFTCMAYDSRYRKIALIEGGGTTDCTTLLAATTLTLPATKTSTVWHATFNLPQMIAEPLRITTFEYDTTGNLLSTKVQPTGDATGVLGVNAVALGALSQQRLTYNAAGQIKTVVSPRTDIVSTTFYDYDASGNLNVVTNAANHRTEFANYDIHGRPGRITDPNGLVTDLVYNERGWPTSSTAGGEATVYTYDGVGQMKTATRTGGPTITYAYDDAHRLTGITDNLGNSVTYTLDLTGNRLSEQVRDPNGVLSRQTTRVFDLMNRLTKTTGAQQ